MNLPRLLPLTLLAVFISLATSASAQTPVYTWNPTTLYNQTHPTSPYAWTTDWVARPPSGTSLKITVPSTAATGTFYNFITVPAGTLQNGQEYTVKLTFEVSVPTGFPRTFYMFARNTAGFGNDIWRKIIDDPGHTRTETFVIDLRTIGTGNTWSFYVGMQGPGSIIIDSFTIVSGSGNVVATAATSGTPESNLPPGVTEATGAPVITITPPVAPPTPLTLSMANYAFVADVNGVPVSTAVAEQNALSLQTALTDCKTLNASKLILLPGTYRLSPSSNLTLNALDDFTLDGQGAELIFTKLRNGSHFDLYRCQRVVVKNLYIDWDWEANPISSLGQVQNFTQTGNTASFDLTFTDLNATQTLKRTTVTWMSMLEYNYNTLMRTNPEKNDISGGTTLTFSNISNNTVHVSANPYKPVLTNGKYYNIRHLYYQTIAFKLIRSNDVAFDNATVYSNPGMVWVLTDGSHHVRLLNCSVTRRTGSRNPYTSSADGVHADQTSGNIELDGCYFTGLGDDSINLHNNCWQGGFDFAYSTSTKLRFLNCALRIAPNDTLEFFDANYSPLNVALVVQSLVSTPDANGKFTMDVTFTTPVPAGIPRLAIVRNRAYEISNVRINNCTFHDTNGRAMLLSAKNVTVEDCWFHHVFSSPIQLHTEIVDNAWAEGSGAQNIVIRNNSFDNNNTLGKWAGAEIHAGAIIPWGLTSAPLFKDILIESNVFWNSPGPSAAFESSQNVVVLGNEFRFSQNRSNATRYAGSLYAAYSSLLALGGNTWVYWSTGMTALPAVVYDPATTSSIDPELNVQTNH
ncbi:MAG: right-handed parallel beta-helix repeat-containing protein [Opitutaceae bacterium]|jgi:hypothetical protein